jgi:nicotinamide-nucleotide amidase
MRSRKSTSAIACAEILAVGTELTAGVRMDTNSTWLRRQLRPLELHVTRVTSLPDDLVPLTLALRAAARRSDLVLVTGGLGPTEDDRTLQALADAAGCRRRVHPRVRNWLEKGRANPKGPLHPSLQRQARLPVGVTPLENRRGTAPGVLMDLSGSLIVALPGVPDEMKGLWLEQVEPQLRRRFPVDPVTRAVIVVGGRRESEVDELAAPICRNAGLDLTTLAGGGVVELHLSGQDEAVQQGADAICNKLGRDIISRKGDGLAEVVLAAARAGGGTLAVAESCTGGRVAAQLTSVPGASDVFLGGVVAYADHLKHRLLGVPRTVLRKHGAVSEAAVKAMASGLRRTTDCTWSVAISGIAGPDGGTRTRPVGTVWFATSGPGGGITRQRRLPGGRERVQRLATGVALDLLRRTILWGKEAE